MRNVFLSVAAVTGLAALPAQAATFEVQIGSPVGTHSCGSFASGVANAPVQGTVGCNVTSIGGRFDAVATATFGHLGGSSRAVIIPDNYFGSAVGITTQSSFHDFVTFTSNNPTATHVAVAANIDVQGRLTNSAGGSADMFGRFNVFGGDGLGSFGASLSFNTSNPADIRLFTLVSGLFSSTEVDAIFRTATFVVPVNTPLLMLMDFRTGAGSGGGAVGGQFGASEFGHSFEIPFGMNAFEVPDGVTVNAGTWLVNNRRVGLAAGIPEPGTWTLMILGFAAIGARLRRARYRPKLMFAPCE